MLSSRLYGLRLKLASWWNNLRLTSSNPLVRSKAVDNLSGSADSRDTERVLASLDDKSARVRCVALRALAKKSNHPKALKSLVSALSDRSAEVRELAARLLTSSGNANVAGALVTCLKDPEPSVRSAAAGALRAIGWRPSTNEEAARFDIALGNTPAPLSAPTPQAEASDETNTEFHRRMRAETLKERNSPAAISALLAAAYGNDLLARISAIHDLGQVTSRIVSGELPKFLRDSEPEVRQAAAQALADRNDTSAAHFVGLLQDSNPEVRLVAVRFFARMPTHQITHILLPLLADPIAHVRQATATTIGFGGNTAAIEDLVVALMDEDVQDNSSGFSATHWSIVLEASQTNYVRASAALASGLLASSTTGPVGFASRLSHSLRFGLMGIIRRVSVFDLWAATSINPSSRSMSDQSNRTISA